MMHGAFPELRQFFGGYFHQDWVEEIQERLGVANPTWQDAVKSFVRENPAVTIRAVSEEMGRFLAMNLDGDRLGASLLELGCTWSPRHEMSDRDWLHGIHEILKEAVRGLRQD